MSEKCLMLDHPSGWGSALVIMPEEAKRTMTLRLRRYPAAGTFKVSNVYVFGTKIYVASRGSDDDKLGELTWRLGWLRSRQERKE